MKENKILSIDFGQAFIKIAYLSGDSSGLKLLSYDIKKLFFKEENKQAIIDFINNFIKSNSVSSQEAYLTLSDPESLTIRYLVLPAMPKEEVAEAAKWQLKEEIKFDLEDSLMDWQLVKEYTDEEQAKKIEVMVILARKEAVGRYISLVSACGLEPVVITSGPFNYAHILKYIKEGAELSCVLDIGYFDTSLCIYKNNRLIFIRKIPFSSEKLTQSMTTTLISDKGRVELSYDEAEELKNTYGIPEDESLFLKEDIRANQVVSLIRPHLEGLAKETKRSFEYFSASLKENAPSFIYLTGGGANLKNLIEYLRKEMNMGIEILPFPECVHPEAISSEKLKEAQCQIINCLAAVLKGRDEVNLIPSEIKTQKFEFAEKILLRVSAVVISAAFLMSLFLLRFQIRDYKNRIKNAQIHLGALKEVESLSRKVYLREVLISKIRKNKVPADSLLKLLSAKLPRSVVLEELTLVQSGHNLILKGVVIGGSETSAAVLSRFIEALDQTGLFKEVSLLSSQKTDIEQRFEIEANLNHQ